MISPCTGCGMTLEHDSDPRTVLCGGCERLDRIAAQVVAACSIPLKPLPEPPPMRNPHKVPTWFEPGYRVLSIAAVLSVGFFLGWVARGGV